MAFMSSTALGKNIKVEKQSQMRGRVDPVDFTLLTIDPAMHKQVRHAHSKRTAMLSSCYLQEPFSAELVVCIAIQMYFFLFTMYVYICVHQYYCSSILFGTELHRRRILVFENYTANTYQVRILPVFFASTASQLQQE